MIACGFADSSDSCGFPSDTKKMSLHVVFAYAIGLVIDCVVVLILCDRIGLFVCVFELCCLGLVMCLYFVVQEQLLIVLIPIPSRVCQSWH